MAKKCIDTSVGLLLHGYELRILSEEDWERFEIHLMSCESCMSDLADFDRRAEFLRSDPEAVAETVRAAEPTGSLVNGRWRQWLWPDTPLVFRPAFLLFVILMLIYPVYRGVAPDSNSRLGAAQVINLVPSRSPNEAVLSISSGRDAVVSFIYPGAVLGKAYQVSIKAETGKVLLFDSNFSGFDRYETGTIIVPARLMKPGNYFLEINDPMEPSLSNRQTYTFMIVE